MGKLHRRIGIIVLAVVALSWAVEPVARNSIEGARGIIEEWVKTRQLISKEKKGLGAGSRNA